MRQLWPVDQVVAFGATPIELTPGAARKSHGFEPFKGSQSNGEFKMSDLLRHAALAETLDLGVPLAAKKIFYLLNRCGGLSASFSLLPQKGS
jgi:hypothetical protein